MIRQIVMEKKKENWIVSMLEAEPHRKQITLLEMF